MKKIVIVVGFFVMFVFCGCNGLNHTKVVAGNSRAGDIEKRLKVNDKMIASVDALGEELTSEERRKAKKKILANTLKLSDELANVGSDHVEYLFDGHFTNAGDAAHLFRASNIVINGDQRKKEVPVNNYDEGSKYLIIIINKSKQTLKVGLSIGRDGLKTIPQNSSVIFGVDERHFKVSSYDKKGDLYKSKKTKINGRGETEIFSDGRRYSLIFTIT